MKLSATRIKSGIGLLCIMLTVGIAAITQRAQTAFAQEQGVSRFTPILMPESGTLVVPIEQSITVDQLRGKTLDQSPPKKLFSAAYEGNHGTRVASGNIPYMSNNLEPFQFDHFTVEWNYGGWHTREMRDYALLHGFNLAFLYSQSANEVPVAPSEYLQWTNLNWDKWMAEKEYDYRRWDQLPQQRQLVDEIVAEDRFPLLDGHQHLMIDMEYPSIPLDVTALREQSWYPSTTPDEAFEESYYAGFVNTQLAAAEAAHVQGWEEVGFYGWAPFRRTWWGLENANVNPAEDWAWNTYGQSIYSSDDVDVIYPSVYSFYWSEQNVAYTLANTDLNLQYVRSEAEQKPVRPYFWNVLHGGGPGWRWWRNLPMRNEDAQAMFAMNFFTGSDGLVLWSWSGTNNPNVVEIDEVVCTGEQADVSTCGGASNSYATSGNYSVGTAFSWAPLGSDTPTQFAQYDAVVVLDIDEDEGLAYFQRIDEMNSADAYGVDLGWTIGQPATYPIYAMHTDVLASYMRASTEPVSAMIEGLALIKPFERMLFEGEPKIDVPAQQQFGEVLPIVRRVEYKDVQLIVTYDPAWEQYAEPRTVELTDFNGVAGLDLVLPADKETRIFVLQSLPNYAARSIVSGNVTVHGEPAPIGTVVEMRNAAGERAGMTILTEEGYFEDTFVFGSPSGASILGIGMKDGQKVRFFVDDEEVEAMIEYYWSDDWQTTEHEVRLMVGLAPTNVAVASMSVESATSASVYGWMAVALLLATVKTAQLRRAESHPLT